MGKCSEKTIAKRISEKTGGQMKYISGYSVPVKYAILRVKCSVCGNDNYMTYHNLTAQYRGCPACREELHNIVVQEKYSALLEKKRNQERNREARLLQIEREKEERAKQLELMFHACPVCGEMTTRKKYCSNKCKEKAKNKSKDIRRREKIAKATVDKDITVMGLFKRDAGICYICGGRCNPEDYTMRGDIFIAGDWYPSIDHVIPLAKGGKHSWGNVKLAHRRCNYMKSDKFAE